MSQNLQVGDKVEILKNRKYEYNGMTATVVEVATKTDDVRVELAAPWSHRVWFSTKKLKKLEG